MPEKLCVPVPLTVRLPPNVGLKAFSLRVPFVAPSRARKSSDDEALAVVGRELMRMSAMLGDGD